MGTLKMAPKLISNGILRPVHRFVGCGVGRVGLPDHPPCKPEGFIADEQPQSSPRLGVLEIPFPQLRAAAHHGDGALNDAFVAGVAGGLRLYHEKHGVTVGDLHLTMPISLREEGDEMGGNRITVMRFDVPVGTADPAERIRQIHERTGKVRHEKSLPYTQWIAGALNMMPRWYIGSILRNVDFLCSDVPGISGARVPRWRQGVDPVRIRPDDRLGGQRHVVDIRGRVHARHRRGHRCDS